MQHTITDKTEHFDENCRRQGDALLLALSVARISFLNFNQKKNLLKKLDSPHSLALQFIEEIFKLAGCEGRTSRAVWNGPDNLRMAQAEAQQCEKLGVKILFFDDEEYPEALRQIEDPPFVLFARGDVSLLKGRCVSVVGTRRLSQAGRDAARNFARDAAFDGCNVVSGLAAGADAYAHLGAIDAFYERSEGRGPAEGEVLSDDEVSSDGRGAGGALGRTIAVLPSGIDNIVPYTNKRLAAAVLGSGGCILSEYGPGAGSGKWQFIARNRIVAALSEATVVIEAPAGSGALITADLALEYGRDVMFHEVAFGEAASRISEVVREDLEKSFATGRVSRYKMENTPEKFLSAGAPVIKDYKDYCIALAEAPGERSAPPVQGELFI